ncbi:carbohydrate binding domain-containing protein [Streptomyces sp. TLI_171]|uniref:carbohydrate binding domain-containing protein n=1 Tax=Streptomyces sp. TLI_171 TaxID=1938859 RepID=UPI000C198C29|nr:carbohydrate binding domain-containing protein [Streptomyces sp. TLI_171]RKE23075.1 hypothetical protein BX266_6532 [Streptomyces sp. TLI_171]
MRAPTRPTRHRTREALPLGLAAGTLALAAAATLALSGTAAADLPNVQLLVNGGFDSVPWIWDCSHASRSSVPHEHWTEGTPTADDYAGCTQQVQVQPNSTYTLSAEVRGPYAFVGARGTGTGSGEVATWSSQSDWNTLSTTVTTGPGTTSLTVYFHGWYEQAPYRIRSISFYGPGVPPGPCGSAGATTAGSPSPTASCTRTPIGF